MHRSLPITLLGILATAAFSPVAAQDIRPLRDDRAMHCYDFWEGTWYQLVDGQVDTTRTVFYVERDVHPAAFVERWRLVIDSATTLRATAIRAWDKTTRRWW